ASSWGSPRDVHLPLNIMEPYLDAAWLSGVPTSGGDVNHTALFQGVLYLLIHMSSPVALPFVRDSIAMDLPRCGGDERRPRFAMPDALRFSIMRKHLPTCPG